MYALLCSGLCHPALEAFFVNDFQEQVFRTHSNDTILYHYDILYIYINIYV
jgi:hypothetical protein